MVFLFSSCDYQPEAKQYLHSKGYTSITMERKYFTSCCGMLNGCKGAIVWNFTGIINGKQVSGKVCSRNCLWGERFISCPK